MAHDIRLTVAQDDDADDEEAVENANTLTDIIINRFAVVIIDSHSDDDTSADIATATTTPTNGILATKRISITEISTGSRITTGATATTASTSTTIVAITGTTTIVTTAGSTTAGILITATLRAMPVRWWRVMMTSLLTRCGGS